MAFTAVFRMRILYSCYYFLDAWNSVYKRAKIYTIIASIVIVQASAGQAHSNEGRVQCAEISQDIIDAIHNIPNEEFSNSRINEIVDGVEIRGALRYMYLYYVILIQASDVNITKEEKLDTSLIADNLPNYMIIENIYLKYSKEQIDKLAGMLKRGVFSCDASDQSPFLEVVRYLAVMGGNYDLDRMPNWGEAAKVDARIMETYLDFLKYAGNMSYRNDVKEWYNIYKSCKDLTKREICIADIRANMTNNMKSRRDKALKEMLCNVIVLVESSVYTHRIAKSEGEICGE